MEQKAKAIQNTSFSARICSLEVAMYLSCKIQIQGFVQPNIDIGARCGTAGTDVKFP